jgi:hypothetical protein
MVERVRRNKPLLPGSKNPRESSGDTEPGKFPFFGPAPLLAGENAADYDEFLEQVVATVKPTGILEQIWARDFVYHEWEAGRLRRLKATLVNDAVRDFLKDELYDCSVKETEDVAEPEEKNDSDATLAEGNVEPDPSEDEVKADPEEQAASELARRWVAGDQEDVDRVDRKIMTAESRRNAVVREVDRHRAMLGLQFRRPSEQIHDAEYKVIEDGKAKEKAT